MSRIKVDRITDKAGTGAPTLVNGMNVTGKSTMGDIVGAAVTFNSITGNLTGNVTGNADTSSGFSGNPSVNTTGIITATTFSGNVTGVAATFTGDVSIGGTLTYEDVTNIDSTGIVTARSGFKLTGGNYSSHATAVAALEIDCSAGNYFTKTINAGSQTFTFANVPASPIVYSMTVEVTHTSGSASLGWPAAVKWPGDTAPSLTDAKTTLFMFVTDDGGTRWRGSSLANYTT